MRPDSKRGKYELRGIEVEQQDIQPTFKLSKPETDIFFAIVNSQRASGVDIRMSDAFLYTQLAQAECKRREGYNEGDDKKMASFQRIAERIQGQLGFGPAARARLGLRVPKKAGPKVLELIKNGSGGTDKA